MSHTKVSLVAVAVVVVVDADAGYERAPTGLVAQTGNDKAETRNAGRDTKRCHKRGVCVM